MTANKKVIMKSNDLPVVSGRQKLLVTGAILAVTIIAVVIFARKHKKGTEQFFAHGVENWDDYHSGYLNFGLWENGITDYLQASERLLGRVADKVGLDSESVLLDVGCGMGQQDIFFMDTYAPKKITAVDLTQKHIDQAQMKLAKRPEHQDYLTYEVGNAIDLSAQKTDFTHVISIEAPVNFPTREKFFHQAFAHLVPGGRLGMSDFYAKKVPETPLEKFFTSMCAYFWHIPQANIYGLDKYKEKLESAGFVDVDLEEVGDVVIPQYYQEQKDVVGELTRIRGWKYARLGLLLDYVTYELWKHGILGYVLVGATKPGTEQKKTYEASNDDFFHTVPAEYSKTVKKYIRGAVPPEYRIREEMSDDGTEANPKKERIYWSLRPGEYGLPMRQAFEHQVMIRMHKSKFDKLGLEVYPDTMWPDGIYTVPKKGNIHKISSEHYEIMPHCPDCDYFIDGQWRCGKCDDCGGTGCDKCQGTGIPICCRCEGTGIDPDTTEFEAPKKLTMSDIKKHIDCEKLCMPGVKSINLIGSVSEKWHSKHDVDISLELDSNLSDEQIDSILFEADHACRDISINGLPVDVPSVSLTDDNGNIKGYAVASEDEDAGIARFENFDDMLEYMGMLDEENDDDDTKEYQYYKPIPICRCGEAKFSAGQQIHRVRAGKTYWFEYHCNESEDSADAELWHHTHQQVRVLRMIDGGIGATEKERTEEGQQATYKVEFSDGHIDYAIEDELLESESQFTRPAYQKKQEP